LKACPAYLIEKILGIFLSDGVSEGLSDLELASRIA